MLPFLCCGPGPGNCPGRICLGPPPPCIAIELCLRLPGPMPPGPSKPALSGVLNPIPPALPGKFCSVALPGAPIMPIARLLPAFMESEGVTAEYIPAPPPGGVPSADRSISFMRMYWYLKRCETGVKVARGRGRWRERAAMMASFSSSESTAPEGSRSSGRGAFASIAAPKFLLVSGSC